MISQALLQDLVCPECRQLLQSLAGRLNCSQCGKDYQVQGGAILFVKKESAVPAQEPPDPLIKRLKGFFKKWPFIYRVLGYLFGSSLLGKSEQWFLRQMGSGKLIVNLGSGTKVLRKDIVNVDCEPLANVDIVADAAQLPFRDNSVDGFVCESMLEHVKDPVAVIKEARRALKPGGLIYLTAPFVVAFHSSPDDYCRWTKNGLCQLMLSCGFRERETGLRWGPTSAFLSVFNEWLSVVLSFGSRRLQQILAIALTIATSPLKLLDYLVARFPSSQNVAYGFYYIGEKP